MRNYRGDDIRRRIVMYFALSKYLARRAHMFRLYGEDASNARRQAHAALVVAKWWCLRRDAFAGTEVWS
jgi:hypothetical protein